MRELERRVVLSVIDRRWQDHLYEMDYLKDGIGLRAMAQRDPLVEYQREGFAMFQNMMGAIREETVGFLFNLEVEVHRRRDGADDRGARASAGTARPTTSSATRRRARRSGEVEVRNQRGQVEQAATQRARRAVAQAQAPEAEAARGAFGQRTDGGGEVAPQNRAERRAQERKGR